MDSLTLREMFVPMLGFITAVIATLAAVLTAVLGPFKRLRLPVESVPGQSRGVLNLVLFAPFLVCFLLIDLTWAWPALLVSLVTLVFAFICYQKYGGQLNLHRYTKPSARRLLGRQWIRDEVIIGGTVLTLEAAERKAQTHAKEQRLLAEAEYKPEEIWTPDSRVSVQKWIERWYYGFMLCALLTVVLAALAGQALLSGEAPFASAQHVWAKVTASSSK